MVEDAPQLGERDTRRAAPQDLRAEASDRGRTGAFDVAIDALMVFYAEDVVCHPAPGWVEYEVCHGHDGLRRLSAVWTANVAHPALDVHEVRDLHQQLLILAHLTGIDRTTGEPVRQPFGVLNGMLGADGKVREVFFFLSWEEAQAAAGVPAR